MITNLTSEQIERGRTFLTDLRANPKKATGRMRNAEGGRCCLCVAYDTAQRLGAVLPEHANGMPPKEIAEFYGWPGRNPKLGEHSAGSWNDISGNTAETSHPEIAELFELEFPQLKESQNTQP